MIIKYSLQQLGGRFLPGIIGFAMTLILTRLLPPEEFGIFGLGSALGQMFSTALFTWIGIAATRVIAGQTFAPTILSSTYAIYGTLAVTLVIFGTILSIFLSANYTTTIFAIILGSIAFGYFEIKATIIVARLDFTKFFFLNITRALVVAGASVLVAWWWGGGLSVYIATALGSILVSALFRLPREGSRISRSIDPQILRQLLSFGLPLAFSMGLFAASAWMDRVVLEWRSGAAEVGLYSAAAVLVQNTLLLAARAIGSAALPLVIASYERNGSAGGDRQLRQNFVALLGFLLPSAIGLCMLAPNIAEVLVGAQYRQSVIHLTPLLVAAAMLSSVEGNYIDHAFHLRRATQYFIPIALIAAGASGTMLLLLVPHYGAMGAALANLCTSVATFSYAFIAARRVYRIPIPLADTAKLLAAAAVMTVALYAVASLRGPAMLFLQILLGASVYGAALVLTNLWAVRDALVQTFLSSHGRSPPGVDAVKPESRRIGIGL